MKKRLLSAFMALALCLTLLPAPAWAEEADAPEGGTIVQEEQQEKAPAAESPAILEQAAGNGIAAQNGGDSTVENAVAEVTIGSTTTQYDDIEAAFTAAQGAESAAVKLLTNVTISKEYGYGIKLESGNIALDLNGCTIQTTGVASGFVPLNAVFYIGDGSSLTVQDSGAVGKIVQPNGGQAIGVINGNLTVKSGIIEVTSDSADADNATTHQNCAVFVRSSGVADIQGGTLIGNRGIYIGGEWGGGTLTVSGGTIRGNGSYALEVVGGSAALSGGTYTTGVENGCSIWNADGTAAALLDSGYRYQDDNGKESAYSGDNKGVVGNTTIAERPANEFSYVDANGKEQTQANCTVLTADGFKGALAGGETWFAAKGNITADGPLQVYGTVNLILCDGVTVTLNKGIALNGQYTQPATLNIYAQSGGTGTLICSGPSDSGCAGIYDNSNEDGNETALNIYGGVITATGTSNPLALSSTLCGAGIGSIGNYKYKSTMTVNISGGTVTAKSGGKDAQAIGNGTNPKGTVTVKIAPGMKCVRTDDLNTACDPGNTNGTSVTVTKCENHTWEYKDNGETHTKTCTLCHTVDESEAHSPAKYVFVNGSQHNVVCVCGKTIATAPHDMQCTHNADGLTHRTKCKYCNLTPVNQPHTFQFSQDSQDIACTACQIRKAAEYNGQQYASLQAAINAAAAAADGGTVKLAQDVAENVTVAGGAVTVDLNGNQWSASISEAPDLWGLIPLTVTGGSVTLENGTLDQGHTSSMGSYGIRIQGGSVTVKGTAVVIGSNTTGSAANIPYPAIILESGDLTLETGATLVYGLKVPEGKTLSDYLPAGTAFGLRSYDESTKTWIVDKGLLNAYTINNYAEHNMVLVVVEHTKHEFVRNSDGKYVCACGYVCPHDKFENGVCTVCRNECAHTNVDENGLCRNCKTQMTVKSETGGIVTYGTDFKSAMRNATNGTKITLLADVSISRRTGISGDNTTVTLDLNEHKITSGWLDVGGKDTNGTYTACTLKIIGKGSYEPPMYGGIITVNMKATLDLSEWEGGTISAINISDNSNYEAATREAAVIVGSKAGTIGELSFGNNQLDKLKKTKLSGGSFNEIWVADFGPVKLGELLAEGYAYQYTDGVDRFVEYTKTLQGESIYNVKVVKCLHPNMKPDATTGIATCEYCGKSGKFVASVDGNLYTDMDEAITYWLANGGTLKLYADYTAANGTWSIGSGSHTINLNGHKMSVQGDGAFFKPTNNMHLTVIDGTEIGQIENILLDGNQGGSFTLESGYVGNLEMTDGAVVALKGGSVDKLDVQNCSASTNLSIQGGSLGAYTLPSGKILADVLDHQYYAEGTSLDRQDDTAQPVEKFVINQAPHDFESTSKAADVPINGSIPFMVDSPSGDATGYYDVRWYRRTNSGAEHMTQNRVAGVNVGDTLDVFCVITGADRPGGAMKWQVAVKGYTINVVPAKLNGDTTEIEITNKDTLVYDGKPLTADVKVTYNDKELTPGTDYTVSGNTGTDAKTYTLTITGKGNYGGEQSKYWTIKPRALGYPEITALTRKYDGTTALPGDFTLSKFKILPDDGNGTTMTLTQGKDFMLNGNYGDASVGENKAFTITITLRDNYHNGSGGNEMTLIQKDYTGLNASITKADAPKNAAGSVAVMNKHANDYEFDLAKLLPTLEAPREYGAVTYGAPTVNLSSGYYTDGARVEDGKLILPIQAVKTDTTGNIGSVKVKVSTTNYDDFTLTINVNATNKIVPTGEPTLSTKTLTYGQALSAIKLSGTMKDDGKTVPGTFAWVDGTVKPNAGSYEAAWKFTPADGDTYTEADGTVTITVNNAKLTGEPIYTKITAAKKTLADANLKPNTSWLTGTIKWVDKDGKELPDTTEVKANTAYKWIFTPDAEFAANYTTVTGELTLYSVSTGGGGGGGHRPSRRH